MARTFFEVFPVLQLNNELRDLFGTVYAVSYTHLDVYKRQGLSYAGVFMMKSMPDSDSFSSIIIGQAMGAVIGFPFLLQETDYGTSAITGILLLGVFQLGLAYIFFSKGMETTKPVAASLIAAIEPILNPVWVAIFFKETVGALALVGAVIVIGSIVTYEVMKEKQCAV